MVIRKTLAGLAAAAGILAPALCAASGPAAHAAAGAVFAVVNGQEISTQEYDTALAGEVRRRFYHRRAPEEQLAALRREIADELVNRVLLLSEARRRDIRPRNAQVQARIEAFEQRVRDQPQWKSGREQMLALLKQGLEEQDMLAQLEAATRVAPTPSEEDLRAFYESRPDLFTQPERIRLWMILLKVDPSSPHSARDTAREQARQIAADLANGANFFALARKHSGDSSAKDGGDMGYRHRGTFSRDIETVIDKLAIGAISEPVGLLEGEALLRVSERVPARLKPLEEVRTNAVELWARARGETQWRELKARLRNGAQISIVAESLAALRGSGGSSGDASR